MIFRRHYPSPPPPNVTTPGPFEPPTRDQIELDGEWQQDILVSAELIDDSLLRNNALMQTGDGLVTFHVRDSSATYGLGKLDVTKLVYPARLLSVEPYPLPDEAGKLTAR